MVIAVIFGMLTLSSAANDHDFGSNVGQTAPLATLDHTPAKSIVDNARGKYLLLTFWQSDNADSRMKCKAYDTLMRRLNGENNIAYLAVNLDGNKALFKQIVKADNLNQKVQVQLTDDTAENVKKAFGLQQTVGSLLIDTDGTVLAVNPDANFIQSLIS